MTPMSGRSSNNTAFPFFNVSTPGNQGVLAAVGWTGKWYADISQANNNSWSLEAGMERSEAGFECPEKSGSVLVSYGKE